MVEKLKPEDAIRFLEEGRFVSTGGVLTGMKSEPFYNPYILNPTKERLELHRRYFEHLLKLVPCYLVNTGADKRSKVIERKRCSRSWACGSIPTATWPKYFCACLRACSTVKWP